MTDPAFRKHFGYEWITEEIDEFGDIQDTLAWDSAADAIKHAESKPTPGHHFDVGLTRNTWTDADGLLDRQWAYVNDGALESTFDGGASVPQRFIEEWKRATNKTA